MSCHWNNFFHPTVAHINHFLLLTAPSNHYSLFRSLFLLIWRNKEFVLSVSGRLARTHMGLEVACVHPARGQISLYMVYWEESWEHSRSRLEMGVDPPKHSLKSSVRWILLIPYNLILVQDDVLHSFKKYFIFSFLEGGEGWHKIRARNIDVREKHWLVAFHTCPRGPNLQLKNVPWPGMEQVTFRFARQCPTNGAMLAGTVLCLFKGI